MFIYIFNDSLILLILQGEAAKTEKRKEQLQAAKAKSGSSCKWWGIVLQYNKHPVVPDWEVKTTFLEKADKMVFQLEEGEGGMMHHQCCVKFKRKQSKNPLLTWIAARFFKGDLTSVSAQPVKDPATLIAYCMKQDATKRGETVTFGMEDDRLVPQRIVKDLWDESRVTLFQQFVLAHAKSSPPTGDREILWLYDKWGNTGKSALAKHLALRCGWYVLQSGRAADLAYCVGPKHTAYIFDLSRAGAITSDFYSAAESVKNGLVFSSKYESGTKIFDTPWVVVLANCLPVTTAWSQDRVAIIDMDANPEWLKAKTPGATIHIYLSDGQLHSIIHGDGPLQRQPTTSARPKPKESSPAVTALGFTVGSAFNTPNGTCGDQPMIPYRTLRAEIHV